MECNDFTTHKIRVLHHDTRILFDSEVEKLGLTAQQGVCLIYICKNGSVHQNDIEQHFGLSKSTVSGIIKRMLVKEIITKESDYPFVTIKPTQKGQELLEQMDAFRDEVNKKLFKGFSKKERELVSSFLDRMLMNVKEEN